MAETETATPTPAAAPAAAPVVPAVPTTPAPAPATPAPAAPAPVTPAPPAAPAAPTGPMSRREARQGLHADLHKPATPAADVSSETPAPETPAATPAAPPETPPGTPAETPADTPEGAKPPVETPKPITIDLDPKHPASMGRNQIAVTDQNSERVVRALLNNEYFRRSTVESYKQHNTDLEGENQSLREELFQLQATEAATKQWRESPQAKEANERYQALVAAEEAGQVPQGTAEQWWNGFVPDVEKLRQQEFDRRMQDSTAKAQTRAAQLWIDAAWTRSQGYAKEVVALPAFRTVFDSAVASFNARLQQGAYQNIRPGDTDAMHTEFQNLLRAHMVADPSVQATLNAMQNRQQQTQQSAATMAAAKEQERKKIADEAIEQFKREQSAKRTATPPHPFGALQSVAQDRAPAPSEPADDSSAAAPSTQQLRRNLRQQVVEDARRLAGGT